MQALTTFALTEAQARIMTPARRLFREAEKVAVRSGLLAMQFVFWTWADCELRQGNAAMAAEVLKRGLRVCKTPSLLLLLAKVRSASLTAVDCATTGCTLQRPCPGSMQC